MRCLGSTHGWVFFEHAGQSVAVDETTFDVTELIPVPETGEWRAPSPSAAFDLAQRIAADTLAACLPPSPSFPVTAASFLNPESVPVPKDVADIARLALRRAAAAGCDLTSLDTARLLASGDPVPLRRVRYIARRWTTASVPDPAPGWNRGEPGYPSEDRVLWDLWGGDAGRDWAITTADRWNALALAAAAYNIDENVLSTDEPITDGGADPAQPHRFSPAIGTTICKYCMNSEYAPVHGYAAQNYDLLDSDPEHAHFFTADVDDVEVCEICGQAGDADIHKQAALAQYYEFKSLYDEIYAKDAEFRAAQAKSATTAGGGMWTDHDDEMYERVAHAEEAAEELYWERDGNEDEDPLAYYVSNVDEEADSMVVDCLYCFDGSEFYKLDHEERCWRPTMIPEGDHVYPVDDESAKMVLVALLYSPEPVDLRDVDPGESCFMESCKPYGDDDEWLGRYAIAADATAPGPLPGTAPATVQPAEAPGLYTPEERARNAARQGRDATGKFAPSGGAPEQAAAPSGGGKARLAAGKTPMAPDQVKALITGFGQYVEQQRAVAAQAPAPAPVTAAAPAPAAEAPAPAPTAPVEPAPGAPVAAPAGTEITDPAQSDVKPINLAIMDPADPTAVLDLAVLVPASTTSIAPRVLKRVAGQTWEDDIALLRQMQGPNPPTISALDDNEYQDVLAQVDQYYLESAGGGEQAAPAPEAVPAAPVAAPAPVAAAYGPYGELIAGGIPGIADTPGDIASTAKLKKYWTVGRGGAKIRWNTPGDMTRCMRHLRKYLGPRAPGYCAKLHKTMTGVWPGDRRNIGRRNRRSRVAGLDMPFEVLTSKRIIESALSLAASAAAACPPPLTAAAVPTHGAAFRIPVLAPVGVPSGDGRDIAKDALSHRELPIPLLWQFKTNTGHDESIIVGRIDSIDQMADGSLGEARGVFDIGPYGKEAERMVRHKFLRGVSVDLDDFEARHMSGADDNDDDDENAMKISQDRVHITKGRVIAATLVAKPSFQECTIELDEEELPMVADGTYVASPDTDDELDAMVQSALVAAGVPLHPPAEWFKDPELTAKTPLTVESDGRVFGHIATWDVDHIGLPFSTKPPRSRSNYAYFHTGLLRTADGSDVTVGQLTLVGGHADLELSARDAARHYDDTSSAFSDVRAGEDNIGIWVAGALRPSVTGDQLRAIRASKPSGDWRPINGRLEMVAVCQVNTPGFPVTRARVASGQVYALVAAGTAFLSQLSAEQNGAREAQLSELMERVSVLERGADPLLQARDTVVKRIAAARSEKHRDSFASASERFRSRFDEPFEETLFRDYSSDKREEYAKKGVSLPDGSYPIANVSDLKNAIRAYGRAKKGDRAKVRRHIRKRARALGKTDLIPESWGSASAISEEFAVLAVEDEASLFRDYSTEKREEYSKKGWAMKGGRYPIADAGDLKRAIKAYGRGDPSDKPAIRRHIRKRARALGKTDLIPESWGEASLLDNDLAIEATDAAALLAAGGLYPDGTPWDPNEHPRDRTGKFRRALARMRAAAKKARLQAAEEALERAETAEAAGDDAAVERAVRDAMKVVDDNADNISDMDDRKDLRVSYDALGTAVANMPIPLGSLNQKFKFSELPEDLQSLIRELVKRIDSRLEGELADKAAGAIKAYMAGGDLLSQPEISAELSRMIRFLI